MTPTPLDHAIAAAEAPDAPEAARARMLALLMETSLCAPVAGENAAEASVEDGPALLTFPLSEGPVALGFDGDARLAAFFGAPTAYVALPGRALAAMLADAGLGLAVNLPPEGEGGAVLPAGALAWAAETFAAPAEGADLSGAVEIGPPVGAPGALAAALSARVAEMGALVAGAWLARLGPPGVRGDLAVLILPAPAARRAGAALAAGLAPLAEALAPEDETVAVGALEEGHPLLGPVRAHGLDLRPQASPARPREAAPPRLR